MSAVEASVVVPTRDRVGLLRESVASALRQESVDFEVIVVDDGSTAPASDVLAQGYPEDRLRVLRHERPRGVAAARNTGIGAARGEWVAFLDDDDLWAPHKLSAQLEAARAAGAEFVYGTTIMFDEDARSSVVLPLPEPDTLAASLHVGCGFGPPSSVMIAADPLRRLEGFDERFSVLADWEMWLRASAATKAAACREVVVGYRRHARNMSADWAARTFDEFELLRAVHGAAADAHGVEFDELGIRAWIAEEQLRTGRRRAASKTYLGAWRAFGDRRLLSYAARALFGPGAMSLRRRSRGTYDLPEWLASSP